MWEPIPLPVAVDFICHECGCEGDGDDLDADGSCPNCGAYDDVEEIPYY